MQAFLIALQALGPALGPAIEEGAKAAQEALDAGKSEEEALEAAKTAMSQIHPFLADEDAELAKRKARG